MFLLCIYGLVYGEFLIKFGCFVKKYEIGCKDVRIRKIKYGRISLDYGVRFLMIMEVILLIFCHYYENFIMTIHSIYMFI